MNGHLELLLEGTDLDESQALSLLETLTDPGTDPAYSGAVLAALRAKGESADELRGFAVALRRRAIRPELGSLDDVVDVVGTGGDRSGSLNLSTGAALLAAASGQRVVKHGNRSVSSQSGSADTLAALGMPIPMDEDQIRTCFERTGFAFLFAPGHHPAMASVAPVRRALATRTIFNVVGPLANPVSPPYGVIGAFSMEIARRMAEALSGMEVARAFVIHGSEGWDEPTPVGPYSLIDVRSGRTEESVEDPAEFGIPRCSASDLRGGDPASNALELRKVFEGHPGPHRDALVLGASLALRVTGAEPSPDRAIQRAAAAIEDGRALQVIDYVGTISGEG